MTDLSFRTILMSALVGYIFNFKGIFFGIISIVTTIVGYWIFKKHFKKFIKDVNNGGSLPEFISSLFINGNNQEKIKYLRFCISVVSMLILIVSIIFELHIADIIFSSIFGIDTVIVFFSLLGSITLYAILGGYKSIIVTDVIQAFMLILACMAAAYFMIEFKPEHTIELELNPEPVLGVESNPITKFLRLFVSFLSGFVWLLTTTESWQRFSATRSFKVSNKGVLWSGLFKVIALVLFMIFGIYFKDIIEPVLQYYQTDTSQEEFLIIDFFKISDYVFQIGLKIALAIIFVGLLMCAVSTVDTYLIAMSHSFTSDIVINKHQKSLGNLNAYENRRYNYVGKIAIIMMAFIIMLFWYFLKMTDLLKDPVYFFFFASSFQFILFPLLLIGLFVKKTNIYALIISIILGVATTFFSWFYILNFSSGSMFLLNISKENGIKTLPLFILLVTSVSFIICNYLPAIFMQVCSIKKRAR
ncbi:hypothetical protein Q4Q47_17930 [Flavivirga sp. MEBiC05379]|uniref:Sodium:solute symporter n=2 Tax=Flavivirga spongiicola TaxID=421621 RepID=A0ABU7XZC9_9FLAO|nr:hypothetical protein [Flavivirga sp. MEBiC05379]MDO5980790.1 hypothetical protein [Flavivirga sp. MEBiC05379]